MRSINIAKKNMVNLQILARGIDSPEITKAFLNVDRGDFAPPKYQRQAYSDIELESAAYQRVMFRCFIIAKVALISLESNRKRCLIIGDYSGYTYSIFSQLFDDCVIAGIFEDEILSLEKTLPKTAKIENFRKMHEKHEFDFIFLDSGIYNMDSINKASEMLSESGFMIYLQKQNSPYFSKTPFDFTKTHIIKQTQTEKTQLFETCLILPTINL